MATETLFVCSLFGVVLVPTNWVFKFSNTSHEVLWECYGRFECAMVSLMNGVGLHKPTFVLFLLWLYIFSNH